VTKFKSQLLDGINYYKNLLPQITNQTQEYLNKMHDQLLVAEVSLNALCYNLLLSQPQH
jgi:hypothetical protein